MMDLRKTSQSHRGFYIEKIVHNGKIFFDVGKNGTSFHKRFEKDHDTNHEDFKYEVFKWIRIQISRES